jgi:catechol-2,3-dioxygenase
MIRPTLHHISLKTTRLKEMIDWCALIIGGEVNFQSTDSASATDSRIQIVFMSNDRATHRIAFIAVPGLRDDPEHFAHAGLHHIAFEYDSFNDLMPSFARLKQLGVEPGVCIDHGPTTSLYYSDPDQNLIELQADNFGNWEASTEWMRTSKEFRQNPLGVIFNPDCVFAAYQAGATSEQLHKDMYAGTCPPSKPLNLHLPPLD